MTYPTQPDRTAPVIADHKIVIHARREEVWRLHADVAHWPTAGEEGGSRTDRLARAPAFVLLASRRARRRRRRDQEAGWSLIDRCDQPLHARE